MIDTLTYSQREDLHGKYDDLIKSKLDTQKVAEEAGEPFNDPKLINTIGRLILDIGNNIPRYNTILNDTNYTNLLSEIICGISKIKNNEDGQRIIALPEDYKEGEIFDTALSKILNPESGPKLGKVLYITGKISSGNSIKAVLDYMDKEEIYYNVASLFIEENFLDPIQNHQKGFNAFNSELFYGEISESDTFKINEEKVGHDKYPFLKVENAEEEWSIRSARNSVNVVAKYLSELI